MRGTIVTAVLVVAASLGAGVAGAQGVVSVRGEGASGVSVRDTTSPKAERIRLVTAAEGNRARYRVREQLVGLQFPNDAVGETEAIEGVIVLEVDGRVVREESRFTVDLTTLKSDKSRRDGYVQRNTLKTEEFPKAVLVPTAIHNLPLPLPDSGEMTLRLEGELTLHGVTRPTVWDVTLRVEGKEFTGRAATQFDFATFGLTIPRVRSVLSVVDEIRLEYDLRLVTAPTP